MITLSNDVADTMLYKNLKQVTIRSVIAFCIISVSPCVCVIPDVLLVYNLMQAAITMHCTKMQQTCAEC